MSYIAAVAAFPVKSDLAGRLSFCGASPAVLAPRSPASRRGVGASPTGCRWRNSRERKFSCSKSQAVQPEVAE